MFGGAVRMDTAGKRLSIPGAAAAQDVRIAVVAGRSLEKLIWQPGILILQPNGTRQGMAIFPQLMCSPAATVWFGGSVNMGTNGVLRLRAAWLELVVLFAAIAHSCAERTISPPIIPSSLANGTQPKMAS